MTSQSNNFSALTEDDTHMEASVPRKRRRVQPTSAPRTPVRSVSAPTSTLSIDLSEPTLEPIEPVSTPSSPRTSTPTPTKRDKVDQNLQIKIDTSGRLTLTKGYTSLYCHSGVILALSAHLLEIIDALHGKKEVDIKLTSNVHVSTKQYKNGVFTVLTKWCVDDVTKMMRPTNISLFLRNEELRALLDKKSLVQTMEEEERSNTTVDELMEIAVHAYAAALYQTTSENLMTVTQAQPRDVEDRRIIDVVPGLFDTVTERRFCEKFYAMVIGRCYNVPAWMFYCAVKDNKRDEVLGVVRAMD